MSFPYQLSLSTACAPLDSAFQSLSISAPCTSQLDHFAPAVLSRTASDDTLPGMAVEIVETSPRDKQKLQSQFTLSEYYPVTFTAKDPSKTLCLRPQEERMLKAQKLGEQRKKYACWMIKGRLIEFPYAADVLPKLSEGFLNSTLGKKALEIAKLFLEQTSSLAVSATDHLKEVETRFTEGTCLGQSYALVIAYSKIEELEPKKLFETLNTTYVLFFQLLEYMNYKEDKPNFYYKEGVFSLNMLAPVQQKAVEVVVEKSGWKYKGLCAFDLLKKESEKEFIERLDSAKDSLVEIGFYHKKRGSDHSILAFFTKKVAVYDAYAGFAHYDSNRALVSDVQNLINKFKILKNPLRAISLQVFSKT